MGEAVDGRRCPPVRVRAGHAHMGVGRLLGDVLDQAGVCRVDERPRLGWFEDVIVVDDQAAEFEPGEMFEDVDPDDEPAVWRATEGDPELVLAMSQVPEPAREFWPDIVDAIVLGV